jgi:hypothetical protein
MVVWTSTFQNIFLQVGAGTILVGEESFAWGASLASLLDGCTDKIYSLGQNDWLGGRRIIVKQ